MKIGRPHSATEVIRKILNNDSRSSKEIARSCGIAERSLQQFANGGQAGLSAGALEKLVPMLAKGWAFGLYEIKDQPSDAQKRT